MRFLFIKAILAILVLQTIFTSAIIVYSLTLRDLRIEKLGKLFKHYTINEISNVLSKTPFQQWNTTLQALQPLNAPKAEIIPLKSINLAQNKRQALLQGKIVYLNSDLTYFFGYKVIEIKAFKKIGTTDYVLQLQAGLTSEQLVQSSMGWLVKLMQTQFMNQPVSQYEKILSQLKHKVGFSLSLIPENRVNLSRSAHQALKHFGISYHKTQFITPELYKAHIIDIVYANVGHDTLLQVGPIKFQWAEIYWKTNMYFLIYFCSVLIISILFWLFSRNIKIIYKITEKYSQAKFSFRPKFSKFSILNPLYSNVLNMGKRLQALTDAQKNMTQLVAHEARAPLTTMQFAVDKISKNITNTDLLKQQLLSLQEDIDALNHLINNFLLYSETKEHKLKLAKKHLNFVSWLEVELKRYQVTEIRVNLIIPEKNTTIMANFDPKLFKHVIDNLVINALKHAKRLVNVEIKKEKNLLILNVDDDGPGIAKADQPRIFDEFVTIESQIRFGKPVGLGLAITRSIVTLHEGSINADKSTILGGARFHVEIPLLSKHKH